MVIVPLLTIVPESLTKVFCVKTRLPPASIVNTEPDGILIDPYTLLTVSCAKVNVWLLLIVKSTLSTTESSILNVLFEFNWVTISSYLNFVTCRSNLELIDWFKLVSVAVTSTECVFLIPKFKLRLAFKYSEEEISSKSFTW